MESLLSVLIGIVLAALATIWMLWPERYVAWTHNIFRNASPAMQAGSNRVRGVFPFSLTFRPWYPKVLRAIGVFVWVMLLLFAYVFYKF